MPFLPYIKSTSQSIERFQSLYKTGYYKRRNEPLNIKKDWIGLPVLAKTENQLAEEYDDQDRGGWGKLGLLLLCTGKSFNKPYIVSSVVTFLQLQIMP